MVHDRIAALTVERLPLSELKPHPRNPRVHPAEGSAAWEVLRESMEHDYFDPLVWNRRNGMLVSGHFRLKILQASGFTHADVSVVDYDEATHIARLIAANNLLGEFDDGVLSELARELSQSGLSASLAGWNEKELAELLEGPEIGVDDSGDATELISEAEKLAEKWKVAPGDIWTMGNHRLICGDCTDSTVLQRLLNGAVPDLVWTDPPYNVNYDSIQEHRNEVKKGKGASPKTVPQEILNDDLSDAEYEELLRKAFTNAFECSKSGAVIYVAHADNHGLLTRRAIANSGWKVAQNLIWVKNAFTLGRQDYQWQHEPILYGWKPGFGHYWQGGYGQATVIDDEETNLKEASKEELVAIIQRLRNSRDTTIIREPRNVSASLHPTIKPIDLVARQIWNSSRRGENVLELFGGSGTTIAASEQTSRVCFASELDPKFCAVILQRMADLGLEINRSDGVDQH